MMSDVFRDLPICEPVIRESDDLQDDVFIEYALAVLMPTGYTPLFHAIDPVIFLCPGKQVGRIDATGHITFVTDVQV